MTVVEAVVFTALLILAYATGAAVVLVGMR